MRRTRIRSNHANAAAIVCEFISINASVFVAVDVHYKKRKLKRFAKVPMALALPTTKSDIGTPMRNPKQSKEGQIERARN
jgi:hypothetical protein